MSNTLTPALLNYLERIATILREKRVARVRDIAAMCNVKVPSACSAMGRLSKLGYIHYETGEYITLTKSGRLATKCFDEKKRTIERFLYDVLCMEADLAGIEAHSLALYISDPVYRSIQMCLNGENVTIFHDPSLDLARESESQRN